MSSIVFRNLRPLAVAVAYAVLMLAPSRAFAQHDHHDDHDDDGHHHAPVHFSHPLFTESPSPDTKLRFDYLRARLAHNLSENTFRVEAEYAFSQNASIEANMPFSSVSSNGVRTSAVGSGEIALKLASFIAADRGILLGGGIGLGVPTGNDDKGIGSGHLFEVEPYVDFGYMHEKMELVSFASYSFTTRQNTGEEQEKSFGVAASLLYHLDPRFESLVEVETRRFINAEGSDAQIVNAGAGVKYHVNRIRALVVGVGGRIPLTTQREFQSEIIASALYHF
ncbi:MAG: transporter [Gemmatimonadaceae bacterium]